METELLCPRRASAELWVCQALLLSGQTADPSGLSKPVWALQPKAYRRTVTWLRAPTILPATFFSFSGCPGGPCGFPHCPQARKVPPYCASPCLSFIHARLFIECLLNAGH